MCSRNHLSSLPPALCQLPLEVLLLANNRLTSLPEEVGRLKSLMEFDISCNQVTHLPPQLGQMSRLRVLNVRNNLLLELPIGTYSPLLLAQCWCSDTEPWGVGISVELTHTFSSIYLVKQPSLQEHRILLLILSNLFLFVNIMSPKTCPLTIV